MELSFLEHIALFASSVYLCFCQEQWLFYKEMQKHCKKNKGICSNCSCWSCPRKLYIDEYKYNYEIIKKDKLK